MHFISEDMDAGNELRLLSTGLYKLASAIIGPEKVVGIRRTVSDLANDFDIINSRVQVTLFICSSIMMSVIESISQCRLYDANTTLLMMETEQTNPGYV